MYSFRIYKCIVVFVIQSRYRTITSYPKYSFMGSFWNQDLIPSQILSNHWSILQLYCFAISKMSVRLNQAVFETGVSDLAWCQWGSSAMVSVSIPYTFVFPSSIPLCIFTTVCLSIDQLKNIWVVSVIDDHKQNSSKHVHRGFWENVRFHFS